jgi:hypothetical protein
MGKSSSVEQLTCHALTKVTLDHLRPLPQLKKQELQLANDCEVEIQKRLGTQKRVMLKGNADAMVACIAGQFVHKPHRGCPKSAIYPGSIFESENCKTLC